MRVSGIRFRYNPGPSERCTIGERELHCGDCFKLKVGNKTHDVRIELAGDWYLVGIRPNHAALWDLTEAEEYKS